MLILWLSLGTVDLHFFSVESNAKKNYILNWSSEDAQV